MKFEWFELLRYLELHAKDNDEFNRNLRGLTKQDALKLFIAAKKESTPTDRKVTIHNA